MGRAGRYNNGRSVAGGRAAKGHKMMIGDIHGVLAKESLGVHPSEDEALAMMILLHTHHVWLKAPILEDRPGVADLAAITQRHAAEVIAAMWPDRSDRQRTDYGYWYYLFNTRTPYEVVEDIPQDWMVRVQRLREQLANSAAVKGLEPED